MINGLTPPPGLSYAQIKAWNDFMKGSPKGSSITDLYSQFKRVNPKTDIDFNTLRSELENLSKSATDQAKRKNLVSQDYTSSGNRFPEMEFNGTSYGPVNGQLKTEVPLPLQAQAIPQKMIQSEVPSDIKSLDFDPNAGLPYYTDPHTSDMQYVSKNNLYNPRFRPDKVVQGVANGLTLPPVEGDDIKTIGKTTYRRIPGTNKYVELK